MTRCAPTRSRPGSTTSSTSSASRSSPLPRLTSAVRPSGPAGCRASAAWSAPTRRGRRPRPRARPRSDPPGRRPPARPRPAARPARPPPGRRRGSRAADRTSASIAFSPSSMAAAAMIQSPSARWRSIGRKLQRGPITVCSLRRTAGHRPPMRSASARTASAWGGMIWPTPSSSTVTTGRPAWISRSAESPSRASRWTWRSQSAASSSRPGASQAAAAASHSASGSGRRRPLRAVGLGHEVGRQRAGHPSVARLREHPQRARPPRPRR